MKQPELKNKVVRFLAEMAYQHKTFPQEFTARETAEAVGGYTPMIGKVAEGVVAELTARGIEIKYEERGNPKKFILYGPER